MKRYPLLAVCSALFLFTAGSYAKDTPATINVNGKGSTAVVPNAFTLTLIMEEKGESVAALNKQTQKEVDSVVQFLLDNGIEKQHIQSMQVNLNPYYESSPQGREQNGFVLRREISISDTNLQQYDRIIDGTLNLGVDRIQEFEFVSSDSQAAYEKALINAVKDAKLRASVLAKELGVQVGDVISVTENGGGYSAPIMRMEAKADGMSSALPGQQIIEARVNVSFAIKQ